jgi:signal transduction histidine kinase
MNASAFGESSPRPIHTRSGGTIAIGLFTAAQVARTLTDEGIRGREAVYLGLLAAYLVLLVLLFLRPEQPAGRVHAYLAVQSGIVLALTALNPNMDYVTSFLIPPAYQAALYFRGRVLRAWVAGLAFLCAAPLMLFLGPLKGLALSLVTVAGTIMIPAYVVVSHEIEQARLRSQALLVELQATNRSLQAYTAQVEELAAIDERNRFARELHDTVSQIIFSIALTTRSAQILLKKDSTRVAAQIDQLQALTAEALGELRLLITQMKDPKED